MALKLVKDLDQAWILWNAGMLVGDGADPWYPTTGNTWKGYSEEDLRKTFDTAVTNFLENRHVKDERFDDYLTWNPYILVEDEG